MEASRAGHDDDPAEPLPAAPHVHAHSLGQEPRHGRGERGVLGGHRPAGAAVPPAVWTAGLSVLHR